MAKISINLNKGTVEKNTDLVVGIDLGTTNSLIAMMDPDSNKPIALSDDSGKHVITPSIIHFKDDGGFEVGEEARNQLARNPRQTVYSVKRLLGKSYKDLRRHADFFGYEIIDEDEDSLVKVKLGNKYFTPIELSAEILKELKAKAEKRLDQSIKKAVITVPAYFNDSQRQATRDAGKLAGLEVLRIVNEPTAASLAYGIGLDPNESKIVAVYDLGGGTFDTSILRIEDGVFEVLATNGNTFLGGDDFDRSIVDHWVEQHNLDLVSPVVRQELRLLAEEAKKSCSSNNTFSSIWNNTLLELNVETFNKLITHLVEETIDSAKRAVDDAQVAYEDISEVVLVGGSTRVPAVVKAVSELFVHSTIDNTLNPDETVALGAAIEADILAGNRRDILLLDVTPLSLGIETMGGLMDVIIPRNSRVPSRAGRNYTTSVDGQVKLKVSVYQGERDKVSENRKLAEFVLNNIPAMPAGLPKIEIAFMLDADGILKVRAKELRSGVEQAIDVKPQYGLTDGQVEQMLLDSLQNAQDDLDYRRLQEATNESKYLIVNTEKFVRDNESLLEKDEIVEIQRLVNELSKAIDGQDKDDIQQKQDDLNDYTKPFAERVMDINISKALKGKAIDE